MKYSTCTICGKQIHLNSSGSEWYDSAGNMCAARSFAHMPAATFELPVDTDTFTVKELRAAWNRNTNTSPSSWTSSRLDDFLQDVVEHREPEYSYGTVWKDRDGVIWFRCTDEKWMRFGKSMVFADDIPVRPLKQMTA